MISFYKLISLAFLAVGTFTLMQILLPIASFQIWELIINSDSSLVSPQTPASHVLGASIEGNVYVQNKGNFPAIISSLKRESKPPFSIFTLSVPSINLQEIPVLVDSNDFSQTLAHLPGSALPGEKGNVFITGHSASRFLFGKSQESYFAKLSDMKKGDDILVTAGGSVFNYRVIDLKVVPPTDLSVVLPPLKSGRYLSLMTCVPPGINIKRLVVIGKMI